MKGLFLSLASIGYKTLGIIMAAPSSSTSSSNKGSTFSSPNVTVNPKPSKEKERSQSTEAKVEKFVLTFSSPPMASHANPAHSLPLFVPTTRLLLPPVEKAPASADRNLRSSNPSIAESSTDQEDSEEHTPEINDNRLSFFTAKAGLEAISHQPIATLTARGHGPYALLLKIPHFLMSLVDKVNQAKNSGKPFDLGKVMDEACIEYAVENVFLHSLGIPGLGVVLNISSLAHIQEPKVRKYLEHFERNIHPFNDEHDLERYAELGMVRAMALPAIGLEYVNEHLSIGLEYVKGNWVSILRFASVALPETLIDPRVSFMLWQKYQRERAANLNPRRLEGRVQQFPDAAAYPVYPIEPYTPNPVGPYVPNLAAALPSPSSATLSRCVLPWKATQNLSTGVTTLSTFTEFPLDELANIESLSRIKWDPPLPDLIPLPQSPNSSDPEKRSFRELSRVIGIREGEARVGGRGLILSLASGAEVSISTTNNKVLTGISAPLTGNLLSSLGSGFIYAAPVAALMIGIHMAGEFYQQRFYKRLEKDQQDTKNDLNRVNDSLHQFNQFLDEFSQGKVNKEAFLAKINDLHEQIHSASKKMSRRGRYLDQDRTELGRRSTSGVEAFLTHFASKTKLRQVDRDLETITSSAVAQRDVQDQYVPQLKQRPFSTLISDLQALINKRVLSINEKYQQEALIREISSRQKNESVDSLNHLDVLTNRPAAIYLQPPGVAKPMHLSGKHYENGSSTSKSRRAERVKNWANDLDVAYQHFREVALTGNIDEIEKAGKAVFDQLKRVKVQDWHTYTIYVENPASDGHFKTTGQYYESFMNAIETNIQNTLAKVKDAKTGTTTGDTPILFTAEDLKSMKADAAISSFNAALSDFQDKDGEVVEKDEAFREMYVAAQVLDSLNHKAGSEEENQLVQSTLSIGREYCTYSNYQTVHNRLKDIQAQLGILQSADKKLKDPSVKKEEHGKQYKIAHDSATRLKELGVVEEDISKLTDSVENAKQLLKGINFYYESYAHYLRVGHYENNTLHIFSTPLARFALLVLNDCHRYEGYTHLKRASSVLSAVHAISPAFLPSAINSAVAFSRNESSVVQRALLEKTVSALIPNVVTTTASFLRSPRKTLDSLNKTANLAQNAGVSLQLGVAMVTAITTAKFGENNSKVNTFNAALNSLSSTVGTVPNALYYANLLNKTLKYVRAGTLSLKIHKVGQGWVGLSLAGFDLYEVCATDPAELSTSNVFTRVLKRCLPKLHGHLPENQTYYQGKDFTALTMAIAGYHMSESSIMGGIAFYQLGALFFNTVRGKYTVEALSANLANCRYFLNQPTSEGRNQALAKSTENLGNHLQHKYFIKRSDSKLQRQAKLLYFECILEGLENKHEWDAIIKKTTITSEDNNYKFLTLNVDVFEAVNILLRHFSAASQSPAHIVKKVAQLEDISGYLTHKLSLLPALEQEKAKDYISVIKENLNRIKTKLLSNFGIFYLNGEVAASPSFALKMFDAIPPEHRDLVDWFVLGCVVCQLRNDSGDPTSIKMIALERFCFKIMVDILDKRKGNPSAFEKELLRCSEEMLKTVLKNTLPEGSIGVHITTETRSFTQMIEEILSRKDDEEKAARLREQQSDFEELETF